MYKDPDKQREAQRNWVRQKRAAKGSTEPKGSTNEARTSPVVDEVKPVDTKIPLDDESITFVTPEGKSVTFIEGEDDPGEPKRGKDIKCFSDLPPDVQATIDRISESDEEKAKRTKIAIQYQHLFPDRYYSTGVAYDG